MPHLVNDCKKLLADHFIFQRDGAPANTVKLAIEWIEENCSEFINKDEWPPNSPDLNPLDYHVRGATIELYQRYSPKLKTNEELRDVKTIWKNAQEQIDKSILAFPKRLRACDRENSGHFEHFI